MPKNDDQPPEENCMDSRIQYKIGKAGRMYVIRRVEEKRDAVGRHTGSIRTVARHDNAGDAERIAGALQLLDQPHAPR